MRLAARVRPRPANVVAALGAHRAKQGRHAMRLGAEYDRDLDLIFAGTFGEPLHPQGLRKDHFLPIRERAELPPIHIHDLRHTHAAQLLAIGVTVKDVSARLGHATARTTLDTYGHVMPSAGKKIAAQIDQLRAMGT